MNLASNKCVLNDVKSFSLPRFALRRPGSCDHADHAHMKNLYIHTKKFHNFQYEYMELIDWAQVSKHFYYVELGESFDSSNKKQLELIAIEAEEYITRDNTDEDREEISWWGIIESESFRSGRLTEYEKIPLDLRVINFLFSK